MKNIIRTILKNHFLRSMMIFLLFTAISFIFLKGIFFSSGVLLGGDWGLPYTKFQVDNYFIDYSNAWQNSNFGIRSSVSLSLLPFALIFKLSSVVGLNVILFPKLLMLFLFSLSGFSLYKLLRFFDCTEFISILCGMIYITTPLFFNYAIMGWLFVLLVMALLPAVVKYFIKSVKEGGAKNYIILSFLIFLSIQSQSIIWYFICFGCLLPYLVRDKNSFIKYIKTIFIVIISFILLNFYWLSSLLMSVDKVVIGSDIVKNPASIGTTAVFTAQNIIRLFGSLYNFQYEYIIENSNFVCLSFVLPLLAFSSLLLKEKKKLIIAFSLIAIFPFFFYFLKFHRDLLLHIPFSNVIRDFGRFSVLSTFAYPVLIGFIFNYLFKKNSKIFKIIVYFFILLIFLSISPWWRFKIADWEIGIGQHQRFRTKIFSKEYLDLENDLSLKKLDQRALYLPSFDTLGIENDDKFHGAFQQVMDIFSSYSNSGTLIISYKILGYSDYFIKAISNNLNTDLMKFLDKTNIGFVIFRKNMIMENKNQIINSLNNDKRFIKYFDSEETVVYEKKIDEYLPHFYVPESSIISALPVDALPYVAFPFNRSLRSSVYFQEQNKMNQPTPEQLNSFINNDIFKNSEKDAEKLENEIGELDITIASSTDFLKNNKFTKKQRQKLSSGIDELNQFRLKLIGQKDVLIEAIGTQVAELPVLEFKKINPVKYRVIIHKARGGFPLIFNESFHEGWKIYPSSVKTSDLPDLNLADYKILNNNKDSQATADELYNFVAQGLISSLGDGKTKIIKHQKWENNQETLDYPEEYKIGFISKNFQGTIQNDNLPDGSFYETWFKKSVENNTNHSMVNGYANSWILDVNEICYNNPSCHLNSDGTYDLEIVVEFWPQRLFYIGLFISGTTLLGCLMYLGYDIAKRRKKKYELYK